MCGIAGGFAFTDKGKEYLHHVGEATACIRHRGPDGNGIFLNESVGLGHRRLSIIDVSAAANQPMFSRDKRYCIIFNGEIFNYKELIAEYFSGYQFATTSDTEVFLELFVREGAECFKKLRGFFAAAIYDTEKKELFIVRDRYGKKPVHVYQDEDALLFGSELKTLFAFGIPRQLNKEALPYYFQLNYIPQPLSLIEGVRKLLPGHYLRINSGGTDEKIYYELSLRKESYNELNYEQAQKKLVELLDEATRLRLIADVPLGSFLSGGIDSSVIVALASRHQQQLKTFSIGYKDNSFFDETYYANLVAKKYNTQHIVFSLSNNDFLEHIDDVLDSIDEPFADSSAIPTFILSKQTRKHVTVALSGDGGDEVFAGYHKYLGEWNMMQPSLKKNIVKRLNPLWKRLPQSRNNKITNKIRQLHRFAVGAQLSPEQRYWRWASILSIEQSHQLLKSKNLSRPAVSDLFDWNISGKDLNEVLLADMKLVLSGDMLVKVDMMSMANSLEIRSPFLDQNVVDFAFGLPASYKINGNLKKRIVQDAFKQLLPVELYNRPKKGFELPLLDFLRKELWKNVEDDLVSKSFIEEQGLFNVSYTENLKQQLQSNNPGDSHATIWALLVFQHWWLRYIAV